MAGRPQDTQKENNHDTGRREALNILLDMDKTGRYSSAALEDGLRKIQFEDKTKRAFITRLVEGTTEYRLQLDAVIDLYAKIPMEKQRPKVRCLLRMSVYQMLYMDSVPDRAVLSEAVYLMRSQKMGQLQGVVNGILRNIQRGIGSGVVTDFIESNLSIRYSTPEWLCERLAADHGRTKAEKILAASFEDRPLTIRCNQKKQSRMELLGLLTESGIDATVGKESPMALLVNTVDFVRRLPGYREGRFSVQDESSMLTVEALELSGGERVLDVCAAPGGKSCYAAEWGAEVTSRDISPDKLDKIRENAERLGLSLRIQEQDALMPVEEDLEAYDIVVADVPCSGLGVMGRKNDIKYHVTEDGIRELAAQGQEILDVAAGYVRPGGRLLFSTCTVVKEENEDAAEHFLKKHPDFQKKKERQFLQGIDPCDGFYYCLMEKRI